MHTACTCNTNSHLLDYGMEKRLLACLVGLSCQSAALQASGIHKQVDQHAAWCNIAAYMCCWTLLPVSRSASIRKSDTGQQDSCVVKHLCWRNTILMIACLMRLTGLSCKRADWIPTQLVWWCLAATGRLSDPWLVLWVPNRTPFGTCPEMCRCVMDESMHGNMSDVITGWVSGWIDR